MSKFNVGDEVSWSQVSRRGKEVSIRLREGVISSINDNVAKVKPPGKAKSVSVQLPNLRLAGEKSELSEFVETVFAANRAQS